MSLPREQRPAAIRARLEEALAPQSLDIVDDSHRHAGHAGARQHRSSGDLGHHSLPAMKAISAL